MALKTGFQTGNSNDFNLLSLNDSLYIQIKLKTKKKKADLRKLGDHWPINLANFLCFLLFMVAGLVVVYKGPSA